MSETIALFPGAFRPPHKAHYAAIKELSKRNDVTRTVVVISGRHRKLPGTLESLAPECAKRIWDIYCKGLHNVSIEMANSSAVDHCMEYLHNVSVNDQLLFCLGQEDYNNADDRFLKLTEQHRSWNNQYSVIVANTGKFSVRATELRRLMLQGLEGKQSFRKALPDHLTSSDQQKIWEICQNSRQIHTKIIAERIKCLIENQELGKIKSIDPIDPESTNPVFKVVLNKDEQWIVKEAKDTEKNATFSNNKSIKPRSRLSAERRCIRSLRKINSGLFELPKVVYFDKPKKILIQTMFLPQGQTLESMLKAGQCTSNIAYNLGQILARSHNMTLAKPLWGSDAADSKHWQRMLYSKTKGLIERNLSSEFIKPLEEIYTLSFNKTSKQFVFLNFQPKHIRLGHNQIGIVDLESSSSFGDPSIDLGMFMGQCLALSAFGKKQQDSIFLIESVLIGYFDNIDQTIKSSFFLELQNL